MAEGSRADPIVIEECSAASPVKILEGNKYRCDIMSTFPFCEKLAIDTSHPGAWLSHFVAKTVVVKVILNFVRLVRSLLVCVQ